MSSYHRERYDTARTTDVRRTSRACDPALCAVMVDKWPRRLGWGQCSRKRGHGPEGAFCRQHARKETRDE